MNTYDTSERTLLPNLNNNIGNKILLGLPGRVKLKLFYSMDSCTQRIILFWFRNKLFNLQLLLFIFVIIRLCVHRKAVCEIKKMFFCNYYLHKLYSSNKPQADVNYIVTIYFNFIALFIKIACKFIRCFYLHTISTACLVVTNVCGLSMSSKLINIYQLLSYRGLDVHSWQSKSHQETTSKKHQYINYYIFYKFTLFLLLALYTSYFLG